MNVQLIKKFGVGLAANLAIVSMFGLACFSLYQDRTATAAVAAAMTLAIILLRQPALLESFEVLSLKAKFTARITEADKLLAQIRRSATVASRMSLVQLAYMNRMGDIGWARKRALLEEVDGLLKDVEIPAAEIAGMKMPFLNLLTLDLSRVYEHSVRELLQPQLAEVDRQIQEFPKPINAGDPRWSALHEQRKGLVLSSIDWDDALGNTALSNLRQELTRWTAAIPLEVEASDQARLILDEVAKIAEGCWAAGTVTKDAEDYLGRYGDRTTSRVEDLRQGH